MNLNSNWWKILSVVILTYVFSAGLLIPLKPGIVSAEVQNLNPDGNTSILIEGYNSNFDIIDGNFSAWLKLDSTHYVKSNAIESEGPTTAIANFQIPDNTPNGEKSSFLSLITYNKEDGYSLMPNSIYIDYKKYQDSLNNAVWLDKMEAQISVEDFKFPYRNILQETIRNIFYHVTLWFSMFLLLMIALVYSIKHLRNGDEESDIRSYSFTLVAIIFGILGTITGSIWAKYTWGTFWTNDVKLNMTAVSLMIYLAYFVLRSSIQDVDRKYKVSAAYNIFAFAAMIPLIFVFPRMLDSLHPGNGGNPGLGGEDLDNTMRMVFYPAIIGMTLLGSWIASLIVRLIRLERHDKLN